MRIFCAFLPAFCLAASGPAFAQAFPPDTAWVPFPCGVGPMVDAVRDQTGAIQERDIVGDAQSPAGFRATDSDFLYLRLRVDDNPVQGTNLKPFAWGFAFSTDGQASTYQVLVTVDGANRSLSLYRNAMVTVPDSPTDPADTPPLATYPFSTHGRTALAPDSNFGGNRDYFVDMAVPWSGLITLGVTPELPIVVWAGTSTNADRLNGDFACHDAMRTMNVPTLSSAASASVIPSSTTAPPGTGGGQGGSGGPGGGAGQGGAPGGTGGASGDGVSLEGGPGCSCRVQPARRSGGALAALMAIPVAIGCARRRRRPEGKSARIRTPADQA
jgi:hypothetical protein